MHDVYLIQSTSRPDKTYVGFTEDLRQRMDAHDAGKSVYTSRYRPWKLETYLAFSDRGRALDFER
jgi:putative endonuclease